MSHPILDRHIERRAIKPLYVFYGNEEFLMELALARLEEGLRDDQGEPPVKGLFYAPSPRPRTGLTDDQDESPVKGGREADELGVAEFLTESRVASLWGPGQLLVLRRVDLNAAALKAISAYLEHPVPRTWVVLLAEGAKTKDLRQNQLWGSLLRQEAALGFSRLKEADLLQWLTREAKGLGKTLTPVAAGRLIEIVGDNLTELSRELEKLVLYAGEEKSLTPQLVNQLVTHSRAYNIFALVEALGEPNPHKRLTALSHLLDLGEAPPKILVMLARQLRQLIHIKEGASQASTLNLPQGIQRKLAQQATRFSELALRSHLVVLHQIDLQLKTSTGSPRLWLEWALLKMGLG
jgi:DNA polymerase III subunit delta